MIYGVGSDLIEIARVQRALARFGERFAQRILCEPELRRFTFVMEAELPALEVGEVGRRPRRRSGRGGRWPVCG
mgnify:CR=1 FL=1